MYLRLGRVYASVSVSVSAGATMERPEYWVEKPGRRTQDAGTRAAIHHTFSRTAKSFIIRFRSVFNGSSANLAGTKKYESRNFRPAFAAWHHSVCNYSFIDLGLIVVLCLYLLRYFMQKILITE